jgi:transcriptional regulator with XRE-family HTH domain
MSDEIGERIKSRRLQLDLSQEALAELLNTDHKKIWRYENGKNTPSMSALIQLARSLDTTTDYLVGLTDDPHRPLTSIDDLTNLERDIIRLLRELSPDAGKRFRDFLEAV